MMFGLQELADARRRGMRPRCAHVHVTRLDSLDAMFFEWRRSTDDSFVLGYCATNPTKQIDLRPLVGLPVVVFCTDEAAHDVLAIADAIKQAGAASVSTYRGTYDETTYPPQWRFEALNG